jgi:hypothetical protein
MVVVVTAAQAALGLAMFYGGADSSLVEENSGYIEPSKYYVRVAAGFFSGPLLGSFCIAAWAILAMNPQTLPRPLARTVLLVVPMLALSTLSRGFFALGAAMAFVWFWSRGWARSAVASFAIAAVGLFALSLIPQTVNPVRPVQAVDDANPRWRTMQTSAESVLHEPVLGAGPGALTARYQGESLRAHLTPLNVAATTGLPALLALLGLLYVLWRGRRRPTTIVLWVAAGALALDAFTQDAEHFRHVWILLGLLDADRQDA